MEKITAIIPTYNEEHNINEALASVSWADEVIVVDSYSTDKTAQISKHIQKTYKSGSQQGVRGGEPHPTPHSYRPKAGLREFVNYRHPGPRVW